MLTYRIEVGVAYKTWFGEQEAIDYLLRHDVSPLTVYRVIVAGVSRQALAGLRYAGS